MIFPWFSRDFPRRVIDLIAELARRPGDDALRQPMCFFFLGGKMNLEYLVKRYLMNLDEILDENIGMKILVKRYWMKYWMKFDEIG